LLSADDAGRLVRGGCDRCQRPPDLDRGRRRARRPQLGRPRASLSDHKAFGWQRRNDTPRPAVAEARP